MHKVCYNFRRNNDNPILVSFRRTGTHWLLCCLEEYFNKPCLLEQQPVDPKYNDETDPSKFLLLHTHDISLGARAKNVIYLHRNPVDVVFSELFRTDKLKDKEILIQLTKYYRNHIDKWKYEEVSEKKTIITYEGLMDNFVETLSRAVKHFGQEPDIERVEFIKTLVTKEFVRDRFPRFIVVGEDYNQQKNDFKRKYSRQIMEVFDE